MSTSTFIFAKQWLELTRITTPWNANVAYSYDKIGRAAAVTGSGSYGVTSYLPAITYRAFALKDLSYANGKTLSLQYDNRMRATQWHVPGVMQWDYSYTNFGENTGRVTYAKNVDDGTLDRSYDYDQVGRLIVSHAGVEARQHLGLGGSGSPDGPYSHIYGYDQFGNRTHREGWGGIYGSYTNDNPTYSNNRQTGLTYDAAGNYTADSTITYDATGQQASAPNLVNAYDGNGVRGKKVEASNTTYYLRSSVLGGQVIGEIDANGALKRGYVYAGGQLVALQGATAGQVSYVHQDPVTKSQRITDTSGAIVSTVDLDPFGGETARSLTSAFQPRKYTTYERDANGGDEAMHRRYESTSSHFSQPDPYDGSYSLANPQSFNRYAYVNNDPVNFVDPTGLYDICTTGSDGRVTCVDGGGRPGTQLDGGPIFYTGDRETVYDLGDLPGAHGPGNTIPMLMPITGAGNRNSNDHRPGDTTLAGARDVEGVQHKSGESVEGCVARVMARYLGAETVTFLKQGAANGGIVLSVFGAHFFLEHALAGTVAVGTFTEIGIDIGIRIDHISRAGAFFGAGMWALAKSYPMTVRESFNNKKNALRALQGCYD